MTVSLRGGRRVGVRPGSGPGLGSGPSVREVCLIGTERAWSEGERVTWSGRSYRVEASSVPAGARDRAGAYAYLTPAAGIAAGG